jgi:hypothetical protein
MCVMYSSVPFSGSSERWCRVEVPAIVSKDAHLACYDLGIPSVAVSLDQVRVQEEVADCAAVVVFFLLVAALPAGSYFFLHRSLVTRYEQLADTLAQQATEVSCCV